MYMWDVQTKNWKKIDKYTNRFYFWLIFVFFIFYLCECSKITITCKVSTREE